ncbi:exonuclease domain-containing protein [Microbacterium sp. GXF6406]
MGYAVIDLETTGFSPGRGDRIVEIGVVLVDEDGGIEGEWTTLVNPQRDVGPTHVHGIRASDVVDAPLFSDIAGHMVGMLSGRVVAAHNQAFDLRFLRAELDGSGYALPEGYAALCTMLWSRHLFGASKLSEVCATLGIANTSAHAALGDARAAAEVMGALLRSAGNTPSWDAAALRAVFPLESDAGAVRRIERPAPAALQVFIDTVTLPLWERVSIPLDANDAGGAVYLDMLARVLEDGLISTGEFSRLDAIAEVARLDAERIRALHEQYLSAAYEEAAADGVLTAAERRDLTQIATILDLPDPSQALPVSTAESAAHEGPAVIAATAAAGAPLVKLRGDGTGQPAPTGAEFRLVPGARVVFTGAMSRSREEWSRALSDAGFITGSVTKNCVVLVVADPASQSGKANTARRHGIPIVTEAEFVPVFEAFVASRGMHVAQ